MAESEKKTTKAYSLDPKVIVWVGKKAGERKIAGMSGHESSDSRVVNDILEDAMEKEKAEKGKKK